MREMHISIVGENQMENYFNIMPAPARYKDIQIKGVFIH
jgi:hypothetical protein